MNTRPHRLRAVLGVTALCLSATALSASVTVAVRNSDGAPVNGAVVQVRTAQPRSSPPPSEVQIDQKDKEFIPHVTAVRIGTPVRFPNSDDIRHHVYSFSAAKTFEIPLYSGMPSRPVVFDRPGVVVLGCNIHDWMAAYVFVSDAPYFAVTGRNGAATFKDLPAGPYRVDVWHPLAKGAAVPAQHQVTLDAAGTTQLGFTMDQKPAWRPRQAASALRGGYR